MSLNPGKPCGSDERNFSRINSFELFDFHYFIFHNDLIGYLKRHKPSKKTNQVKELNTI